MTKKDFIAELCLRLKNMPPDEAQSTVLFYSEAIDDRIEEGMSEEDAVRAMGSIDDIVREAGANAQNSGDKERFHGFHFGESVEDGEEKEYHRTFPAYGVEEINITDSFKDISVSPSPDEFIHVEYTAAVEWEYEITEGRTFSIKRNYVNKKKDTGKTFSVFGINITIPDISFTFSSGDSHLLKVKLPQSISPALSVTTGSGDITVHDLKLEALNAKAGSGDITFKNVICRTKSFTGIGSGDAELINLLSDEHSTVTGSGDCQADRCSFREASFKTASGDMDMDDLLVSHSLRLNTVSGDIDCRLRDYCSETSVESLSGDIDLVLYGNPTEYFTTATSRSGDVDVPPYTTGGIYTVRAKSASGDISIDFEGR